MLVVGAAGMATATNGGGSARLWTQAGDSDSTVAKPAAEVKIPESSIVDEVVWVVGDEPILKSDVEVARLQMEMEGQKIDGDPDFRIPQ